MEVRLGWWVICMVPYPEPEGVVCLKHVPKVGDKIELPSEEKSHPGRKWTVINVSECTLELTVELKDANNEHM